MPAYSILYIMSCLLKEGPTIQLYNIIKYLDRTKFQPVILTISDETKNSMRSEFIDLNTQIYSMNFPPKFGGILKAPFKIKKIVKAINPDLIHSFGFRPDLLTVFFLNKYKKIISMRENNSIQYPLTHGKFLGTIMSVMHRKALRHADLIVSCSDSINVEAKRLNPNNIVIRDGVNREPVILDANEKAIIKSKLNLPLNKKIFISVGYITRRKDPETLIKGFLMSKVKDEILLFLGEGDLFDRCKRISESKKNNIIFRGFVNNVFDYLMASDYYLSASLSEGLPNAVLEALSVGLPVCLSDIAPHKEILSLNNNIGEMFNVKDQENLSVAINRLIEKDYYSMQQAAIKIFNECFKAQRMSYEYQKVYIQLINTVK